MHIFPGKWNRFWNGWEIQVAVLLSFSLQIILICIGNSRKHNTSNRIRVVLWMAYLSADWVATVSLGVLSNNEGDSNGKDSTDPNQVIKAFWAPFLLLHLGGPDTITAYSLEDNELWLRHLLGLLVQVGVACYVFIASIKPTQLNYVAIPVLVAGVIKYAERTWVLRSSSSQQFRESLLPPPDPGPNYAKDMEEFVQKEREGFKLTWHVVKEHRSVVAHNYNAAEINDLIPEATVLNAAYDFFLIYRRLFADLIFSFQDLENSLAFFQESSWEKAFRVIEIELGFMYDILYTKATIIHSIWGVFLRFIWFSSMIIALVMFCVIDWHGYSRINLIISFVLLIGAICLEIYSILLLLASDWTLLQLTKHRNPLVNFVYKGIGYFSCITSKRKWSGSMAQYNLLTSCIHIRKWSESIFSKMMKTDCIHIITDNFQDKSSVDVPPVLKESIFLQLLEKSQSASDFTTCKKLCAARGDRVLLKMNCLETLSWTVEHEFDHSILLWHIATDLCIFSDQTVDPNAILDPNCKVSKLLSDYMLYILIKRPFMFPNGIGHIKFQDTCAELKELLQDSKYETKLDKDLVCKRLLQVKIRISPSEVKGDRSKSLLFDACKLAKSLQALEVENQWSKQHKWEMVSQVWVEMLSYAAGKCAWNHHAEQLRRGGELITHVWFLMAHLHLTEKFQISQGHARTKLIRE